MHNGLRFSHKTLKGVPKDLHLCECFLRVLAYLEHRVATNQTQIVLKFLEQGIDAGGIGDAGRLRASRGIRHESIRGSTQTCVVLSGIALLGAGCSRTIRCKLVCSCQIDLSLQTFALVRRVVVYIVLGVLLLSSKLILHGVGGGVFYGTLVATGRLHLLGWS